MNAAEIIERFQDLQFPVEVEFGSLEISVREMLELSTGTVLRTSHPARAPLTLRAGNAPIAEVETVLNGESLSVRVQSILDTRPEEAAKNRKI